MEQQITQANTRHPHAAELHAVGLLHEAEAVWLNVRISIPPSLASYMQGTGEGSPGLPLPDLASLALPLFLAECWRR